MKIHGSSKLLFIFFFFFFFFFCENPRTPSSKKPVPYEKDFTKRILFHTKNDVMIEPNRIWFVKYKSRNWNSAVYPWIVFHLSRLTIDESSLLEGRQVHGTAITKRLKFYAGTSHAVDPYTLHEKYLPVPLKLLRHTSRSQFKRSFYRQGYLRIWWLCNK